jgi:diguanylate cyclase
MVSVILSEFFLKWDLDKVNVMDNAMRLGDFLISLFLLIAFWLISMVAIRFEMKKNEASIQMEIERLQLLHKLNIDMLTGINNRFAFRNSVKDMEEDDSNNSYIFAIIDIDNFKKLNDTYGHLMGDHCLIEFGKILKENCVESVPFRYGGDEFCILFRNHTMEKVVKICEQIQIDLKKIIVDRKSGVHITASFGVSTYTKGMVVSKLITNADNALYEAKKAKDRICIHNES